MDERNHFLLVKLDENFMQKEDTRQDFCMQSLYKHIVQKHKFCTE